MMKSPYSLVGSKLIDAGLCAIPLLPGTKKPADFVDGRWTLMNAWSKRYIKQLPIDREITNWELGPSGGVCVLLGAASGGLLAIDVDLDECVNAVMVALPHTPFRKRGKKGVTLFYRGAIDNFSYNRNVNGIRERMVDVLGEGRQTVMPPSIHPDTKKPYHWVGEKALENSRIEDIPEIPANAIEIIAKALIDFGYQDKDALSFTKIREISNSNANNTPFRDLNDQALAKLDNWVPDLQLERCERAGQNRFKAVASWRSSSTGRPLAQRNQNLSISSQGITDFGDGPKNYTAIDLVMAAHEGAIDHKEAFIWLSDRIIAKLSDVIALMPRADNTLRFAEEANIFAHQTSDVISYPPWRSQIDITKCPGLVGIIADWITESSQYPQPLLAMAAALSIVGTAAGRQICGPTKSGTHLYTVCVAPTGAGKDAPLKSISRIMTGAGLGHLLGGSRFKSDVGIYNRLIESPNTLCIIDEFGSFLGRLKSRTASTHEQGISAAMRIFWSASGDIIRTPDGAGELARTIYSPSLTLIGTSTAQEFYDAITGADIANGFLNRFLVVETKDRVKPINPKLDPRKIPSQITDGLKSVYNRLGELGNAPYQGRGDLPLEAAPVTIPWANDEVERKFNLQREEIHKWMNDNEELAHFMVRTAEMSLRLATIRSIGINPSNPKVTLDDMLWGSALAQQSATKMIEGSEDRISENERQKWANRIYDIIKKKGTVRIRDIQLSIRSALKSSDIKTLVGEMVETGRLHEVDITDKATDSKKVLSYEVCHRKHHN